MLHKKGIKRLAGGLAPCLRIISSEQTTVTRHLFPRVEWSGQNTSRNYFTLSARLLTKVTWSPTSNSVLFFCGSRNTHTNFSRTGGRSVHLVFSRESNPGRFQQELEHALRYILLPNVEACTSEQSKYPLKCPRVFICNTHVCSFLNLTKKKGKIETFVPPFIVIAGIAYILLINRLNCLGGDGVGVDGVNVWCQHIRYTCHHKSLLYNRVLQKV